MPVTECFLNKNQTVQLISDSTGGSVDTEEIVALFSSLLFSDDNERMIWISEICNVSFWERVHRTLTKGLDDEVNRCSSHVVLGIDFLTIIKTIKNISVSEGEKIANNIFVNGLLNGIYLFLPLFFFFFIFFFFILFIYFEYYVE